MKIFKHYTDMEVRATYLCNNYDIIYLKKTRPYKVNFRKELFNEMEYRKRNNVDLSHDIIYYWHYTRKV